MTPAHRKRDDVLVSVCLADPPTEAKDTLAVRQLASLIGSRYRFWEIVLVVNPEMEGDADDILLDVENVRILKVRSTVEYYRRRAIAASEAIGDVVVLTSISEMDRLDILSMIDRCLDEGALVIARRDAGSMLEPVLQSLGSMSGFRVSTRDLLTAIYTRTLLSRLLMRPERHLALRFPPRDPAIPVIFEPWPDTAPVRRSPKETRRRLGLAHRLLINAAPSVLSGTALFSVLVIIASLSYAVYGVFVWVFLETVQPGWLTTTLAISLSSTFLGIAIFGITTGIQKLIELLSPHAQDDVVDERSAVDMFGKIKDDLNVEVEASSAASEAADAQKKEVV